VGVEVARGGLEPAAGRAPLRIGLEEAARAGVVGAGAGQVETGGGVIEHTGEGGLGRSPVRLLPMGLAEGGVVAQGEPADGGQLGAHRVEVIMQGVAGLSVGVDGHDHPLAFPQIQGLPSPGGGSQGAPGGGGGVVEEMGQGLPGATLHQAAQAVIPVLHPLARGGETLSRGEGVAASPICFRVPSRS